MGRQLALFLIISVMILLSLFDPARRRRKKNIFNSVRCIFIITTIIMDRISCAPNDNNAAWILRPQPQQGEGIEELKHLLFCTTLELERTRANAETLSQLQEAKMLELQELLTVTRRERDEARELLLKLSNRVSEISMLKNKHHHVMPCAPEPSQWPNTKLPSAELDHELNPSTATSTAVAAMHSSQLDQFHWNSAGHHFDSSHLDVRQDIDRQLQLPTSSSMVHCSNFIELQEQQFYHQNEQQLSFVEHQEHQEQQQHHRVESHLPPLVEDKSTDCDFWPQQQQEGAAVGSIRQTSNSLLGIAELSAGGHMTYHDPKPGLDLASPPSILGSTQAAMPAHLPEPPEADLQVMLSTLPERGKLLQAVMQAGPLLQTLLLSGPLPQWRCPPPVLGTMDIPKVSMNPTPNSLPVGPMVHHVPNPNNPSLQVNSPVFSSHQNLSSIRTRINEAPTSAFMITPLQSASAAAASSSSKLLCAPSFNPQDSAITTGPPRKFAKIH